MMKKQTKDFLDMKNSKSEIIRVSKSFKNYVDQQRAVYLQSGVPASKVSSKFITDKMVKELKRQKKSIFEL